MDNNLLARFEQIQTLVFDVDGVFTDNNILITETGEFLRRMNVKDGYAVKCAIDAHLNIAIITGGKSQGIIKRFNALGVQHIWSGVDEKGSVLQHFLTQQRLSAEHTLYMGDDILDIAPLKMVGLPTCPADAVPEVLSVAHYISPLNGGFGCVRDVIEKVLKLKGKWGTNYKL